MDDAEVELVRRSKSGDRAAYTALLERYWQPVCAWLTGISGLRALAEDCTQETFLKVWQRLAGLESDQSFRAWLFRVARMQLLEKLRSRPQEELPANFPASQPSPLQQVQQNEGEQALQRAIARLPETQKTAYLLWTSEELNYAEMAAILECSEETARWRVSDARRRLLRELQGYV